jgi:hypothetical protein
LNCRAGCRSTLRLCTVPSCWEIFRLGDVIPYDRGGQTVDRDRFLSLSKFICRLSATEPWDFLTMELFVVPHWDAKKLFRRLKAHTTHYLHATFRELLVLKRRGYMVWRCVESKCLAGYLSLTPSCYHSLNIIGALCSWRLMCFCTLTNTRFIFLFRDFRYFAGCETSLNKSPNTVSPRSSLSSFTRSPH